MPQGFRRESRPFGKRCELRPANFGMHPSAHATIGAGTAEQVMAQAAQYRRAGADELALSFAGPQPDADAAYFARAVKRLIPDGELAIDVRRSPPE